MTNFNLEDNYLTAGLSLISVASALYSGYAFNAPQSKMAQLAAKGIAMPTLLVAEAAVPTSAIIAGVVSLTSAGAAAYNFMSGKDTTCDNTHDADLG